MAEAWRLKSVPPPQCQAYEGKGAIGAKGLQGGMCGQVRGSGRSDKVGTGQSAVAVSDGRAVRPGGLGF